jgi:hypothetical protein
MKVKRKTLHDWYEWPFFFIFFHFELLPQRWTSMKNLRVTKNSLKDHFKLFFRKSKLLLQLKILPLNYSNQNIARMKLLYSQNWILYLFLNIFSAFFWSE